jgi:hypothetical protein
MGVAMEFPEVVQDQQVQLCYLVDLLLLHLKEIMEVMALVLVLPAKELEAEAVEQVLRE